MNKGCQGMLVEWLVFELKIKVEIERFMAM